MKHLPELISVNSRQVGLFPPLLLTAGNTLVFRQSAAGGGFYLSEIETGSPALIPIETKRGRTRKTDHEHEH